MAYTIVKVRKSRATERMVASSSPSSYKNPMGRRSAYGRDSFFSRTIDESYDQRCRTCSCRHPMVYRGPALAFGEYRKLQNPVKRFGAHHLYTCGESGNTHHYFEPETRFRFGVVK